MHSRVLTEIKAAEMCSEGGDRSSERSNPMSGEITGAVRREGTLNRAEIIDAVHDRSVGGERCSRLGPRNRVEDLVEGRPEARVDASERPPVGLVGSEDRVVTGGVGQSEQLGGWGHEARRHREAAREIDEPEQMVAGRRSRVRRDRVLKDLRGDEGVAVTVPSDPRPHLDEAGAVDLGAESFLSEALNLRLELWHNGEETRRVVAERFVDLVVDPQLREAQDRRLPEGEHLVAHRGVDLGGG